ncbi:CrcB family protein [Nesterenkonia sp. HG001]|uniref:fluoride efflux transporter FluC n=1 Tax=Nesterenkonia sp. HG001 TaxID=2983207 RepID=UPI002AC450A6|nr:CrcB family protein [Nesterenkonia sp. HG001]MDZ5076030.1 CrcB family protein [Nesterenkonia sp. HG001]
MSSPVTPAPAAAAPTAPPLPALILLVACAGAVGALLRLSLGQVIPEHGMKFPWTTLLINITGSGMLGMLTGIAAARPALRRWAVPVLGTGLLGSYTTFSLVILAVMPAVPGGAFEKLSAVTYVNPGTVEMLFYLLISVIASTGAAAAGITVGRAIFGGVEDPYVRRSARSDLDPGGERR